MKLEEKHIKGYLGTGLKFKSSMDKPFNEYGKNPIWTLDGVNNLFGDYCLLTKENNDAYEITSCKPILHPLPDLTKHCEDLGFVPLDEIKKIRNRDWIHFENEDEYCEMFHYSDHTENTYYDAFDFPYEIIQKLYEWHFDIHGLIPELAIDINTIL